MFVFWGLDSFTKDILEQYRGSEKTVEMIVNTDGSLTDEDFHGIPIVSLDAINSAIAVDHLFVARDKLFEQDAEEIRSALGDETGVVSNMKWFYTMFSDENVKFIPSQARLDVCTLCQLNCTSCYMRNDSRQTTGIGYVALDKFEAFLDNNPSLKHIEISNSGEPFLHPQMHELIRMAYDHGVELSCRNGTNFNNVSDEVIEDIVECGFTAIAFSVDGVTQEAYAKYRRNGNVEKVFGNIKSLIEAKKRHGAQLPDLVWQFVLMSHNIHEIQAAETKAKELGIRIRFRDTWDLPERKKVQEMLGKKVEAALSDKKNTFYDYCKDLFTMPQVNWDGRLLGCCQIYRSDWGVNVFSEGLVETVNSERYRNTLLNLASGTAVTDLSIPCSTCRWQPGNSRNTSCEKA